MGINIVMNVSENVSQYICYVCRIVQKYTPRTTKLLGGYFGFTPSRLSVCLSLRSAFRVCFKSPIVMDELFPY